MGVYFELAVLILVVITNFLLAFIVYKNSPKSVTSKSVGLLSVITAIWLIVNYLALQPMLVPYSLWLSRLSIFLAVPQVTLFLLLADTLPHERFQLGKKLNLLLLLAGVIMLVTISPFAF